MIRNGMFLADRYEILEKIGSGGMADVYKAKCHKLNRFVAIKILKDSFAANHDFVKKFKAEAQSAAGLTHDNIVAIYDVGEEKGLYYIVMELVEGITLKEFIRQKKKLTVREATAIAIQVAQGLQAAHDQNIIHRDIKPQNIILARNGKAKVTDFGIAKIVSDYTSTSLTFGSIHYLSPEQAQGLHCDQRTDIYSLGVTMYEMLTGFVPFDGENPVQVAMAHINRRLTPPSKINSEVPPALDQIIQKCMEKRPANRYNNCEELIQDLRQSILTPFDNFVVFSPSSDATLLEQAAVEGHTVPLTGETMEEIRRSAQPLPVPLPTQETAAEAKTPGEDEEGMDEEEDEEDDDYEENSLFDKFILGIAIGIAVILVILTIYICGSLLGWFQKKPKTPAVTTTASETYSEGSTEESLTDADMVRVPDVRGLSKSEAIEKLNKENLGYEVLPESEWEGSEEYPAGTISWQSTPPGDEVKHHTRIRLKISLGSDKVKIRSGEYVGRMKKYLVTMLRPYDLKIEFKEEANEDAPKDQILRLDPAEGSFGKGDSLTVYVSSGPAYVTVPTVLRHTTSQAEAVLHDANLALGTVTEAYDEEVSEGLIVRQSLKAGTKAKVGSSVDVVISKGPQVFSMPDLKDYTKEAAIEALTKLGVKEESISFEEESSSTIPKDIVISHTPAAGEDVKQDQQITIVLSAGEDIENLVLHQPYSKAKTLIEEAGLHIAKITKEYSDEERNLIIGFEAPRGKKRGSPVYITISLGPETTPTKPSEQPTKPTESVAPTEPSTKVTEPATKTTEPATKTTEPRTNSAPTEEGANNAETTPASSGKNTTGSLNA